MEYRANDIEHKWPKHKPFNVRLIPDPEVLADWIVDALKEKLV